MSRRYGEDRDTFAGLRAVEPVRAAEDATERSMGPFFERAAARGERGMSWIRIFLSVITLVRLVGFYERGLADGQPKYWITFVGLTAAIAGSIALLALLDSAERGWSRIPLRALLACGVALDSICFLVAFLPVVLWPSSDYAGVLRAPDASFFLMATIASGIRLSKRITTFSAVLNILFAAIFIFVDETRHPSMLTYGLTDVVLAFVLFAGAAAMGFMIAVRTRRLVLRGAKAMRDSERSRSRLGAYVSEEVAREVLAEGDLRVGGTRKEVAVLFSDLRGFTRYAEHLEPEQLVAELNAYLDAMVTVIRAEGGVVDKFIGDSIMAVFGGFDDREDDAARAMRTALAMQRELKRHNVQRAARGLPPLAQGVGVHFGTVVAGNIGNAERVQYTVIGDTVNLAARLESATKDLGVPVLFSAEAVAAAGLPPHPLVSRGRIHVKGREADIEVFTLAELAAEPLPAYEPSIG